MSSLHFFILPTENIWEKTKSLLSSQFSIPFLFSILLLFHPSNQMDPKRLVGIKHIYSSSPNYPIQNHNICLFLNKHISLLQIEYKFSIFFVAAKRSTHISSKHHKPWRLKCISLDRTGIYKARQIAVLWRLLKAQAVQNQTFIF